MSKLTQTNRKYQIPNGNRLKPWILQFNIHLAFEFWNLELRFPSVI